MFEFLDIRTLSMVMGGAMLVFAVSMVCYLLHRKTYGNFRLWTLGMGCLALGFLLIGFRGMVPDMVSIVLANALIIFSFVLIYLGFKALENDLSQNEYRYRQLVEESSQGLIIARDNPMAIVFASSPMATICGYTPAELESFTPDQLMDLIHPEDREYFFENFRKRLAGIEMPPIQQYRILHKIHGTRWVETYSSCITYDGQPAVHTHFLDITQRKEAEAVNAVMIEILSAVTTTGNLKALFHSIHNSLGAIFDVTNFFIALKDNQTDILYFPYYVDTVDDDFSPIPMAEAKNSLTGLVFFRRRPTLLKQADLIERATQKEVWGTVPLIWMGVPLMVKDEVIGVVAVQSYTDPYLYTQKDLRLLSAVSLQMALAIERKQAQDALAESEKRYRHLFVHAPAGICEVDFENKKFIRVNDIFCKFSGYPQAELLDMDPFDLLTKESRIRLADRLAKLVDGQRDTQNIEYDLVTRQGVHLSVAVTLDFVYEDQKLQRTLVVVHDITRRKQLEKEKIEAQKLLGEQKKLALIGQVAGKMAHDFNNILGIIMGNIELMLLDHQDPGIRKTLQTMLTHTEKGQNLTRNLVAFARNQEPRQKYFQLNQKIDLSLALMENDLAGICITKSYARNMPDILADPGMVEHALINLLQNAVHALSKTAHPEITLETGVRDNTICFTIRDNGCGIPKEHIDHIFEPSFTLKGGWDLTGAYAPGIKGTGYGLSNIQKYVHQHKGSIFVTSETGQGTCVSIHFPIIETQLTMEEKQILSTAICRSGMCILLVEDEPDISHVQHRVLTQEPCFHQVDVAVDGRTAMALFDKKEYDIVSLDYMLPGTVNGMDVYRHIRKNNKTIPVLFVSGNIEFLESIKTLKEKDHHVAHLSKPCRAGEYVECINCLVGR
jgi:PAS domain S-box-containing protein